MCFFLLLSLNTYCKATIEMQILKDFYINSGPKITKGTSWEIPIECKPDSIQ